MKKRLLLRIASAFGLAVMLFGFWACQPKDPCESVSEPQDSRPFSEQMRDYLTHNQGEEGGSIGEGQYVAYFDLSDGMEYAYRLKSIEPKLENVVHKVTANNDVWEVYGLESGEVKKLSFDQTTQFNRIVSTRNTGIMAPIEEAMKQIVKDKKPALLVTDFEEYKKDELMNADVIEPQAYAARYFQQWMGMHGVIKFYITNYNENQLSKKLFFVVFDNKSEKLIRDIDFCMSTAGDNNFVEYKLQSTPYKVFTDYSVGKGGNYIRPNGIDPLGLEYVALDDMNTETYSIPLRSWLQAVEELMDYRTNPNENFTGLISKLYVDLSDTQSRNIEKLSLRVTDITNDFNAYTRNAFAKRYAPSKGEDGSLELTCEQQFFYDGNGDLYSGYQYVPTTSAEVTKEHFIEINQKAFEDSRSANPQKTEIVIDFGKEFTDTTMFDHADGVYQLLRRDDLKGKMNGRILKLEVCIAESGVADYSDLDRLFNFQSNLTYKDGNKLIKNKVDNRCITQSVSETLQKGDLDGRVIYTYIIKDNPDAE